MLITKCEGFYKCYEIQLISHHFLTDKSKTAKDIFNTPFIVLLSVFLAVIVLLVIAIVFLIFRNRIRPKHKPSNPEMVFSNIAYKADSVNNLDEEVATQSNDVDLGTGTARTSKQKRQDCGAIYEQPSRPLPPLPGPHNTTRKEEGSKKDSRAAASITPVREEHYMGLLQKNGDTTSPSVLPSPGPGANNYMSLSPGRPRDTSHSSLYPTRIQTSAAKWHGNNGKRRKKSREIYENTGK